MLEDDNREKYFSEKKKYLLVLVLWEVILHVHLYIISRENKPFFINRQIRT